MARAPFLTYSTAVILQAVANGTATGSTSSTSPAAGGTVYPALRRLEDAGHLTSTWEKEGIAQRRAAAAAQVYRADALGPRERSARRSNATGCWSRPSRAGRAPQAVASVKA